MSAFRTCRRRRRWEVRRRLRDEELTSLLRGVHEQGASHDELAEMARAGGYPAPEDLAGGRATRALFAYDEKGVPTLICRSDFTPVPGDPLAAMETT